MLIGRGKTRVGGESDFAYDVSCRPSQKSSFPRQLCLGLLDPTDANICPMEWRYLLTERFLMVTPLRKKGRRARALKISVRRGLSH